MYCDLCVNFLISNTHQNLQLYGIRNHMCQYGKTSPGCSLKLKVTISCGHEVCTISCPKQWSITRPTQNGDQQKHHTQHILNSVHCFFHFDTLEYCSFVAFWRRAARIEQYQSDGSNSLGNQMTAISQGNSWEGFSFRLVAENRWIFSVQYLHATYSESSNKCGTDKTSKWEVLSAINKRASLSKGQREQRVVIWNEVSLKCESETLNSSNKV